MAAEGAGGWIGSRKVRGRRRKKTDGGRKTQVPVSTLTTRHRRRETRVRLQPSDRCAASAVIRQEPLLVAAAAAG